MKKAHAALALGALLISASPVFIKAAAAPGVIAVFYRLLIGSLVILFPFLWTTFKNNTRYPLKGIAIATLAGIFLASDMALWSMGIMASNATMPTLVVNLASLWVGIGATLFFKERHPVTFWLGLLAAFTGVSFLIIHDFYVPAGLLEGLLLGLLAGLFYAGFMLCTQSGRKQLETIPFLFFSSIATTVALGLYALLLHAPFTGYSLHSWQMFAAMGILIQAGAWFMINYAQGHIRASLVSPTLLIQPIFSAVIAWLWLGETLSLWHISGGIIVVIGIYMVHFSTQKGKTKKRPQQSPTPTVEIHE